MMQQVTAKSFGAGVNLKDAPDIVRPDEALDALNVSFSDTGAVRSRDGYDHLTTVEGTNRFDSLGVLETSAGVRQLVAGGGNRLDVISTPGAVVASSTAPLASPHFFARYGDPDEELVFCGNGVDALRTWNGTAFATPAWTGTAPTGKFVAVAPWDNRLVNARRSGTTGGDNRSSVRFSDPGIPTTWDANNYVDLDPGDGEEIVGMVAWGNDLYVFKRSRFYVFYGTSTASTGTPVFPYREVTGAGAIAPKAIVAAREGVYFLNGRGVYRTTGGPAQLVSARVDPLFLGGTSDFYQGAPINQGEIDQAAMGVWQERLYVAVPTGISSTNDRTLVFDPEVGWWSIYDLPIAAVTTFEVADEPDLVFARSSGEKHIARHSDGFTTDAGSAITSRVRLAWSDMGVDAEKHVRRTKIWGKGKAFFGLATDYDNTTTTGELSFTDAGADALWGDGSGVGLWGDGTDPTALWGGGTSLTPRHFNKAVRGTVVSTYVQNADATAWSISRITYFIGSTRSR